MNGLRSCTLIVHLTGGCASRKNPLDHVFWLEQGWREAGNSSRTEFCLVGAVELGSSSSSASGTWMPRDIYEEYFDPEQAVMSVWREPMRFGTRPSLPEKWSRAWWVPIEERDAIVSEYWSTMTIM